MVDEPDTTHGPVKLPPDIWSSILKKLCPASLFALEGPSTIARYIIKAQLVCDSQAAIAAAWGALATQIQSDLCTLFPEEADPSGELTAQAAGMIKGSHMLMWELHVANPVRTLKDILPAHVPWDQVVSKPMSLERAVLKEACRCLGEGTSEFKSTLVSRILKYFTIDRPCAAPALVLLAVRHEKVPYIWTQRHSSQSLKLESAVSAAFKRFTETGEVDPARNTMFAVRKVLASNFASITHLLQWARAQRYDNLYFSRTGSNSTKARGSKKFAGIYMCACGSRAAVTCQRACCQKCCHGPCSRHKL